MSRIDSLVSRSLRRNREAAGLSRDELARAAEIDAGILEEIEGGRRRPSAAQLLALGVQLGVSVEAFFVPAAPFRTETLGLTRAAQADNGLRDAIRSYSDMTGAERGTAYALIAAAAWSDRKGGSA